MVAARPGVPELLAATSHRTTELELFQIQAEDGPCHECITTGATVVAPSAAQITSRWPVVGEAIVAAGFDSAYALPVRWNGVTVGGLNVFGRSPDESDPDIVLGQVFADVIGMLLVRDLDLSTEEVTARVQGVLAGRAAIEQAKGLLAYRSGIPIADAYDQLLLLAERNGSSLSVTAADLIRGAERR